MSYWREKAQSIIYPALREGLAQGLSGRSLRRHIRNHYIIFDSANLKKFYPYRVWCDEVDKALGGKNPDGEQIRLNLL